MKYFLASIALVAMLSVFGCEDKVNPEVDAGMAVVDTSDSGVDAEAVTDAGVEETTDADASAE
jgi:hypothetical protein